MIASFSSLAPLALSVNCRIVAFVIDEARQINEHIAAGRAVHYQRKSTDPWRRIVAAEPVGSMIKFDFADGSFRLCRCWLGAAQNADESYSLAWNLKTGEV
jgi:hypothetical protein